MFRPGTLWVALIRSALRCLPLCGLCSSVAFAPQNKRYFNGNTLSGERIVDSLNYKQSR